jgi:phosphonate transport system substrate-binding protein
MYRKIFFAIIIFIAAFMQAGCNNSSDTPGPKYSTKSPVNDTTVYSFAVHPLYNPQQLSKSYQPLMDYLNSHIEGIRFELVASTDYQAYEAKYRARGPDFLLPNPWQTIQAEKVGYNVIAMAGDAQDFKGIFIVRKDSGIKTPADLKGKVVSYPSYTALAACIMPQYYLYTHGIDVNNDITNIYVGSQESSIMNAYLGKSAAAATWPPPWRVFQKEHPKEASELKLIWETKYLLNNSVMVRDDVPKNIRDKVRSLLIGLKNDPEGQSILAGMETAAFHPADNSSYEVVRDYIIRFEKDVRPVEIKQK